MTVLAWAILGTLVLTGAFAVAVGTSLLAMGLFAALMGIWLAVGLLVQRDARRLGFADPEWAGSLVVVWGFIGLARWLGYRRRIVEGSRRTRS